MTTATIEDRIVTRLAAITAILTDPDNQKWMPDKWRARAGQLAERPDPVSAPPAGSWFWEASSNRLHLSSGIAEQPFLGACNGWFVVVPACSRRYSVTVDVPGAHFVDGYRERTIEAGDSDSLRCSRCAAIEAGKVKPANWLAAAS